MSLLHSLVEFAQWEVIAAHMNFQTRGADSDADQELVRSYSEQLRIRFIHKKVDAPKLYQQSSDSFQKLARDLRYQWFEELLDQYPTSFFCLAHTLNDQAETLFLNLANGTGPDGWKGIPEHREKYFRPFLSIKKDTLYQFAKEEGIPFREDKSNESNAYDRNKVRNIVFPSLEEIFPAFQGNLVRSANYVAQAVDLAKPFIIRKLESKFHVEKNKLIVEVGLLEEEYMIPFVWYTFVRRSGFEVNYLQVEDLLTFIEAGKRTAVFSSGKLHAYWWNGQLVVAKAPPEIPIMEGTIKVAELKEKRKEISHRGFTFSLEVVDQAEEVYLLADGHLYLALDKLPPEFSYSTYRPLKGLGFFIRPDGMEGKKKSLKAIFQESELKDINREVAIVFYEDREALAIIPLKKLSDKLKVSPNTNKLLHIWWSGEFNN